MLETSEVAPSRRRVVVAVAVALSAAGGGFLLYRKLTEPKIVYVDENYTIVRPGVLVGADRPVAKLELPGMSVMTRAVGPYRGDANEGYLEDAGVMIKWEHAEPPLDIAASLDSTIAALRSVPRWKHLDPQVVESHPQQIDGRPGHYLKFTSKTNPMFVAIATCTDRYVIFITGEQPTLDGLAGSFRCH